jgi:hypothetical protein
MNKFAAGLALALLAASTMSASALDRRVQINNRTSYDIVEFYASNTGTSNWEEDILGSGILPSGSSVMINIDDGSGYCKYDFLAAASRKPVHGRGWTGFETGQFQTAISVIVPSTPSISPTLAAAPVSRSTV